MSVRYGPFGRMSGCVGVSLPCQIALFSVGERLESARRARAVQGLASFRARGRKSGQGQPPIFRGLALATSRPWQIRIGRALSDIPSTECPLYACHTMSMNVSRWSPPAHMVCGVKHTGQLGRRDFAWTQPRILRVRHTCPPPNFPLSIPPTAAVFQGHVGERSNRVWSAPRCRWDASATLTTDNRASDFRTISRPCTNPRRSSEDGLPHFSLLARTLACRACRDRSMQLCGAVAAWTRNAPRWD